MNGLHILAEFHTCAGERRLLLDAVSLAALCRRACAEAGLEVVAEAFHQFADAGATGALVLAESHLAIHTWPELDAVTLDLYVCNYSQDNRAAAERAYNALRTDLKPSRVVRRDVIRGGLDMLDPDAVAIAESALP
ncbi:MAG: S-adenosylmethionine decarboxylase proenzyme [Rhodocyclales bacterium RIFCSPLOWO2_02_FULL_63_24]|nr:MAG: S-adenosylmethionine decarboxylase proenzyme [Rhodocyclales bacterium GWA2_65_19]OHC70183.1 MAG: S-adenosylmethionine decarboxylase proenzyme [Rhodocyclales bacterium RIFCSPLOWO2_02_FULL_63_24]